MVYKIMERIWCMYSAVCQQAIMGHVGKILVVQKWYEGNEELL